MDALDEMILGATQSVLHLPSTELNFVYFWEQVAWWSWMIRLQLIFNTSNDEIFAAKNFNAFSATARLKVVARLCNATDLTVD